MKTILEVINLSARYLEEGGIARPRRAAEELIADLLDNKRVDLYLHHDTPLQEEQLQSIREAMVRRKKGEPAAYITGQLSFAGAVIKTSAAVLIPRPETEILVERVAKTLENRLFEGKVLWDMCCGSGCIGIALKKRFPALKVVLADVSHAALEVAKDNAEINEVEVACVQSDFFSAFSEQKCDYFVCNPPYVSEEEFASLSHEVRDYEPKKALVSGPSGLEFYEKIAVDLPRHLGSSGSGWLEIGSGQGESVKKIFENAQWRNCRYEPDWAGHDRFFFLEKEGKI